jgi:hypothetical protein
VGVLNQNEPKIIEAMPSKQSFYGLFSPKKLNPNLIAIICGILFLAAILVYTGRHNKVRIYNMSIETNIPSTSDSLDKVH